MMDYILVKLQCTGCILLQADFTTAFFRNMSRKLANLKTIFQKKSLWCTSVLLKLDLFEKRLRTLIYL